MLPDLLRPGLTAVFVGTSVATASAQRGHYYAGRNNAFWRLTWQAGLTGSRPLTPVEDGMLVHFGVGLTDLVKGRAASSDQLLRRADFDVPGFLARIERCAPLALGFNGKKAVHRVFDHLGLPEPAFGPSTHRVGSSAVFVLPSSSGAGNDPRRFAPHTKTEWWQQFGSWVETIEPVPGRRVVLAFNDAITRRDLDVIESLMTDDHRFVDSAGNVVGGRAACVDAWRSFFAAFADYRNVFAETRPSNDGAIEMSGRSECSDARLREPARWTVRVREGLVEEWRVHEA